MGLLRRLTLFFLVGTGLLIATTTLLAGSAPSTQFNFSLQIANNKHFTVDVDPSSVSSTVDEEGDTLSAGVFRLTFAKPLVDGKQKITTFVNTVVGVCGYDGVIVMNSALFNEKGQLVRENTEMSEPINILKQQTPSDYIYAHLCPGKSKVGTLI